MNKNVQTEKVENRHTWRGPEPFSLLDSYEESLSSEPEPESERNSADEST